MKKKLSKQTHLTCLLSALALVSACQSNSPGTKPLVSPSVSASTQASAQPSQTPASSAPTNSAPIDTTALGMKFVSIPAGSFTQGDSSAGPAHRVTLSKGFQMMSTEVTQAQWQAVMGNNPSYFKGENLPVESISWKDIQGFIQKLNTGSNIYRLPSEAEWEYAARAGSTTNYSCGDDESCLTEFAWYIPNSSNSSHPVGQKKPNALGLFDMHGNVSEWVEDRYEVYSADAVTDPKGASKGDYRLQRGGNWNNYAKECRSAARNYGDEGGSDNNLGFRLVRESR